MRKRMLLITGNGFDLKCGLHCKYIDYWNFQIKTNKHFKDFVQYLKNNSFNAFDSGKVDEVTKFLALEQNITFLDIYFTLFDWSSGLLGTDYTWAKIEDVLLYGFTAKYENAFNFNNCFYSYSSLFSRFKYPNDDKLYHIEIMAKYLQLVFDNKDIKESLFRDYIIDELDNFSSRFSKYVDSEVNSTSKYFESAKELIMKITGVNYDNVSIITFNYTNPINSGDLTNIHGSTKNGKIVFGITCGNNGEDKSNTHESWFYPATKEFKIANVVANGTNVFVDCSMTKYIYIYGSSIGKQDYDFFENLFNQFNILSGKSQVTVIFCFSRYNGKTKDDVSKETVKKVSELINKYGDCNKNYGLFRSLVQNGVLYFKYIE